MTDREEFELKISMEYEQPPCIDRDCDGYADGYVDNAWWGWQTRGELDAVKIKELEAEILSWQGKSIEREQHLQIANSAVEELTAKLDKARKEDEANERWLAQLASECSDPNQ